jgi:copper chaperone CopZ
MPTTLHIKGTHCPSCKVLIEDVCREFPGVKSASVNYQTGETVIEHEGNLDLEKLRKEIESFESYTVID